MLPIEILRYAEASKMTQLVAGAIIFGLGHFLTGHNVTQFAFTTITGFVFSYIYLYFRQIGMGAAYQATATAHATTNLLILLVDHYFPNI